MSAATFLPAALLLLVMLTFCGQSWIRCAAGRPGGDELLLLGIKANHQAWIDEALADGASPNARDADGMCALTWAAEGGNEPLVRRLLLAGADLSAASNLGMTALGAAAANGHAGTIAILLDAGADMKQPGLRGGATALHLAAAGCHEGAAAVLLSGGAILDARDDEGLTSLMVALDRSEYGVGMARQLIAAGADVRAADATGRSVLARAQENGNPELVRLIEAAAADADHAEERQRGR